MAFQLRRKTWKSSFVILLSDEKALAFFIMKDQNNYPSILSIQRVLYEKKMSLLSKDIRKEMKIENNSWFFVKSYIIEYLHKFNTWNTPIVKNFVICKHHKKKCNLFLITHHQYTAKGVVNVLF